jgi:arylsulfatase A-like enzyme
MKQNHSKISKPSQPNIDFLSSTEAIIAYSDDEEIIRHALISYAITEAITAGDQTALEPYKNVSLFSNISHYEVGSPLRKIKNLTMTMNTLACRAAEEGGAPLVYVRTISAAFAEKIESATDEIFYPEEGSRAPKAMNENQRGEEGGKYYYSHYEGQLNVDENGKNYTSDDETIDAAIDKIKNWKDEKQPLCMFLGLFYPHPPYQVEEPYFSAIDRSKLPDRIRFEDCIDKSKMLKQYHEYQNLEGLNEDEWDEIRATYAGMCMKVDEQFGKLVQALKDVGIYDDCAIFVMSDHGDFVGDYGMAEKAQSSFEDCLTKVPFLVKPPKNIPVDAGVSDSMVELVDFYATVMDFAEVVPSHEHFGRSLRGAVIDRSKQVREFSCCEGGRRQGELQCDEYHQPGGRTAQPADVYWPKKMAQADDEAHAKATMLRTKSFKYVSRITGEDELYDLKNDPQEKINQINNIEYKEILLQLKDKLLRWMQETSDIVPFDYDSRMNETMLWNLVKGMVPADKEDDVRGKITKCHKYSKYRS